MNYGGIRLACIPIQLWAANKPINATSGLKGLLGMQNLRSPLARYRQHVRLQKIIRFFYLERQTFAR